MRGIVAVALLVGMLLVGGCGDEKSGTSESGARYLDPRSDIIAAVSLDYDGDDWAGIKKLYARAVQTREVREQLGGDFPIPPTLDGALNTLAQFSGLSFQDDIKPLLGGRLVVSAVNTPAPPGPPEDRAMAEVDTVAVYKVPDAEALDRVIGKLRKQGLEDKPMSGLEGVRSLGDGVAVVDGDTIVFAEADERDSDEVLRARLTAARDGGDGPSVPDDEDALVDLAVKPAWLGSTLDAEELRRALEQTSAGRALRGARLRVDFDDADLEVRGRVDFEGLPDEELPLGPAEPLSLPRDEAIASAAAHQDRTTVFLARIAREILQDSRFVERVERLEREEELEFEEEVLRSFSGPAATIMRIGPDGETQFAARSALRDPAVMRELLPRIAPALPGILEGLQGLRTAGLTALLFAAPDAPLTPAAALILAAVQVQKIDDELYEVRGLDPDNRDPLPPELVYGVIGDVFVVGSTRELAEHAATMPVEDSEPAGARLRIDLQKLGAAGAAFDPFFAGVGRALFTTVEIDGTAEDGDIVFSLSAAAR